MSRESYLLQPQTVETYEVTGGTDIILRKNIEKIEKTEMHEEKEIKCTMWECDEVQYQYKGKITEKEVKEKFEYWFEIAEGKSEIEAIDKDADTKNEPGVIERLEALENGLAELAEVMCNG